MELAASKLFWAAAHALSRDMKVFVASGAAERCAELAQAGAAELVYLAQEAPAAGVKAREDYRERASSKDLLVDPEGSAPIAEVKRLLKKHGAYLCLAPRALGEGFELSHEVRGVVSGGEPATLSIGAGGSDGEESAPLFYLYATHTLPAIPELSVELERAAEQGPSAAALQAELDELQATIKKLERSKATAQKGKAEAKKATKEAEAARDELSAERDELNKELKSAQKKLKSAQAKAEELKELKRSFKRAQAELESREAELEDLQESVAAHSQQLSDLQAQLAQGEQGREALSAELERLKDELKSARRELKLHAERKERAERAEEARAEAEAAYQLVAEAWTGWLTRGFDGELPEAPPASASLAQAWINQLLAAQPLVSATREEHQELLQLRVSLRESEAREALLTEERDEARLQAAAERARGGATDEQLHAQVEAERALRITMELQLQDQAEHFARYEAELERLQSALDSARRQLSASSQPGLEGDLERGLRAELASRDQQRVALESILSAQQSLQAQLTSALQGAIEGRSRAELERDQAEARARALELQLDPELRLPVPRAERRDERPRREEHPRRDERPRRKERSRREERPRHEERPRRAERPSQSAAERISQLSDRLKGGAVGRAEAVAAHQGERRAVEAKLHPASAEGAARVRSSAERLKEQARARASSVSSGQSAEAPKSTGPSPLELMSDEERLEHAERAQQKLKESLKRLSRKR